MRASLYLGWTVALIVGVTGCNSAKSPADVQHDVGKALESSQQRTDAAVDKADTKITDAAVDAAVTAAEGDHKVALAQCEALAGDAQKACKAQADASLETAKANAKALKADHG